MGSAQIGYFLQTFIQLLMYLIIFRCVLTFFPALDWNKQPWLAIRSATDPILLPFRNIIPPIGGLDLSPILLFFLLDFLQGIIGRMF